MELYFWNGIDPKDRNIGELEFKNPEMKDIATNVISQVTQFRGYKSLLSSSGANYPRSNKLMHF
jgi:hypothetical protein